MNDDRWIEDPRTAGDVFSLNSIQHLDGVKWSEAPLPKRFHFCTPQSREWQGLNRTDRCACGGMSTDGRTWIRRNERRQAA